MLANQIFPFGKYYKVRFDDNSWVSLAMNEFIDMINDISKPISITPDCNNLSRSTKYIDDYSFRPQLYTCKLTRDGKYSIPGHALHVFDTRFI